MQITDSQTNNKKIFISHRSTDKAIAGLIETFFVQCGIPSVQIFCSSLPGNDIQQFISHEIKENLKQSVVNIVILSKDYYQSTYCHNEAGIIWFLDVDKIVISLPDIHEKCMQGFLNNENILRRLDSKSDILTMIDILNKHIDLSRISMTKLNANVDQLMVGYDRVDKSKYVRNNLIYPDGQGFYTAQISDVFDAPLHRFFKLTGLLKLNTDISRDESHWICSWGKRIGPFEKGDTIKFEIARYDFKDAIMHGEKELKNVRNVTPKLTIQKI